MLYNNHVLLLFFSLCLMKPAVMKKGMRNKRVLYGLPGFSDDRDRYPSFRYYVFLSKGTTLDRIDEDSQLAYWLGLTAPNPKDLVCGGSLLTPSIVQTACHCISTWFYDHAGDNMTYALPKNVWEDRIYSYFGSNIVSDLWDRLRPKYYMIYSKCKQLRGATHLTHHDYGLIISDDSVDKKNPSAAISYVPTYPVTQILEFHYKALYNEFMCLLIGHGPHEVDYDDEGTLIVDNQIPQEIRWGWRTLMNYLDCFSVAYPMEDREVFYYNYTRDSSWVCAYSFSADKNEYYVNTRGDSGGPMTCSNVYFSIFSMTTPVHADDVVSYSGPIVNTHFENAAEYRAGFLQFIQDYVDTGEPAPIHQDELYTPTPIFHYHPSGAALSNDPQNIMHLLLIILCTYVFSAL